MPDVDPISDFVPERFSDFEDAIDIEKRDQNKATMREYFKALGVVETTIDDLSEGFGDFVTVLGD